MSAETQGFDPGLMQANLDMLADNSYPGIGIVLGNSADDDRSVQVYWVMGRSPNSRNRVLTQEDSTIKTEPLDPSQVEDPSLIIYNAMREIFVAHPTDSRYNARLHIVSNGEQTDAIYERISNPGNDIGWSESFRHALTAQDYEPDTPNFTPRVSGMITNRENRFSQHGYHYSIIRRNPATDGSEHTFGHGYLEEDMPSGAGLCFHTYQGDGDPLPAFEGSPYPISLEGSAEEIAESFWGNLNPDNKVALVAKTINTRTGEVEIKIMNQKELVE